MESHNVYQYNTDYQGDGVVNRSIIKPIQRQHQIKLDKELPSIEQIMKARAMATVKEQKISRLSQGEGAYALTLIISIRIQVEYISAEEEKQIHTAAEEYIFSEYLVDQLNEPAQDYAITKVVIEDVYVEALEERLLYTNITMLLVGEIS